MNEMENVMRTKMTVGMKLELIMFALIGNIVVAALAAAQKLSKYRWLVGPNFSLKCMVRGMGPAGLSRAQRHSSRTKIGLFRSMERHIRRSLGYLDGAPGFACDNIDAMAHDMAVKAFEKQFSAEAAKATVEACRAGYVLTSDAVAVL